AEQLKGTDVLVCTVIGFPLGASTKEVKAFETKNAIENGAKEIDMVINIGALKDKRFNDVKEDIESVVTAANGKTVKVIIETVLLTDEE
ncbi:deoxyribose-phosphate aldolase, partial [Vibrio vulnificus]